MKVWISPRSEVLQEKTGGVSGRKNATRAGFIPIMPRIQHLLRIYLQNQASIRSVFSPTVLELTGQSTAVSQVMNYKNETRY